MNWKLGLAVGLLGIFLGCATPRITRMPTKPTLRVIEHFDGSMTLIESDARALGIYILELERTAKECSNLTTDSATF